MPEPDRTPEDMPPVRPLPESSGSTGDDIEILEPEAESPAAPPAEEPAVEYVQLPPKPPPKPGFGPASDFKGVHWPELPDPVRPQPRVMAAMIVLLLTCFGGLLGFAILGYGLWFGFQKLSKPSTTPPTERVPAPRPGKIN